jgi:hypothetical protein
VDRDVAAHECYFYWLLLRVDIFLQSHFFGDGQLSVKLSFI